jgi:hypothetical protein
MQAENKIRCRNPYRKKRRRNGRKTSIRKNDEGARMQMKQYADDKSRIRENNLEVGAYVLVKQNKSNKLSTPYNPNSTEVVKRKGTIITARNDHVKLQETLVISGK